MIENLRITDQGFEKYIIVAAINQRRFKAYAKKEEIFTNNLIDTKKAELIFLEQYNEFKNKK